MNFRLHKKESVFHSDLPIPIKVLSFLVTDKMFYLAESRWAVGLAIKSVALLQKNDFHSCSKKKKNSWADFSSSWDLETANAWQMLHVLMQNIIEHLQ